LWSSTVERLALRGAYRLDDHGGILAAAGMVWHPTLAVESVL